VVGAYEVDGAPGIYRLPDRGTIDEDAAIRPDSLYGVSKAFGEILGRYYAEYRGLAVVCVRIGTVRPDDDPASAGIASSAAWLDLTRDERYERMRATWLSHRDCADLLAAAIETDVRWAVVYGVSDNPRRFWSLEGARRLLGFEPSDRAPGD
jgi:NAD+ dependent glucose-6-phosphate dehydrogenase